MDRTVASGFVQTYDCSAPHFFVGFKVFHEFDRVEILAPAVNVGHPFARLPRIVEVKQRCDGTISTDCEWMEGGLSRIMFQERFLRTVSRSTGGSGPTCDGSLEIGRFREWVRCWAAIWQMLMMEIFVVAKNCQNVLLRTYGRESMPER
jgi:hypothetical protein